MTVRVHLHFRATLHPMKDHPPHVSHLQKEIKPPDNLMFLRQCQLSVCGGGADLHRVWRGSCQMLLPTHTAGDDHDGDHDDQDDGGMTMMVMTTTKIMVVMTITIIMMCSSL